MTFPTFFNLKTFAKDKEVDRIKRTAAKLNLIKYNLKNLIAIRTANYRLRTNLQSFRTTIGMSDSSTKNHATTS